MNKDTGNKSNSKKATSKNNDTTSFKKNGYERPKTTFTEQMSPEQIKERLEDYSKVDDIYKVPLGVHLRYFVNKDGQMLFRMGGQLHKNTGLPEYVILSNGTAQWSVQIKDTIFWRKMTTTEIKEDYQTSLENLKIKYDKIKEENKILKEKLKKYEGSKK
jgi:hypothetical protein